jgi:hypothetical protein
MKDEALAGCAVGDPQPHKPWREDGDLMEFLRNL